MVIIHFFTKKAS